METEMTRALQTERRVRAFPHPRRSAFSRAIARVLITLTVWASVPVAPPAAAAAAPVVAGVSLATAAVQPATAPPVAAAHAGGSTAPRPTAVRGAIAPPLTPPPLPVSPVSLAMPPIRPVDVNAGPQWLPIAYPLLTFPLMQLGAGSSAITRTHMFAAGWNLLSIPLQPTGSAPSAVFDELPSPLRIYDYFGGQWVDPSEAGFRSIAPGRTYWLLLESAASVSVTGTLAPVASPFEIALQPGWNGIATPWLTAVEWTDERVSVRSGGVTRTLSQAVAAGWIDGDASGFNPASEADVPLTPNAADALLPWQGYRLFAHVPATLIFAAPPADTTPPATSFQTLDDGSVITEPTPIVGTISDPNILEWRVERIPIDGGPATIIGSGDSEVVDGTLATFDPTLLLNGQYLIRLVATDTFGATTTRSVSVVVRDQFKVGHFTVTFTDLEVPLSGMRIRVNRTYDSRDQRRGDFGFGWRVDVNNTRLSENGTQGQFWQQTQSGGGLSANYCVQPTKTHVVAITLPTGQVFEFEPRLSPECQRLAPISGGTVVYRARPGTLGTLRPLDGDGVLLDANLGNANLISDTTGDFFDPTLYELELADGRKLVIHQQQGLQLVTDPNGNQLSFGPAGILHNSGIGVSFIRDAEGRIERIIDPNGNALRYGYDANGDLTSFIDREENATTFEYHAALPHFLEKIQDPFGRQPLRNEYDAQGRLIRHTDAFGKTIEYTHSIGTRQEVVKDRNGKLRVLEYDGRGNVLKETQPDGRIVVRTFDSRNNKLTETEPHDPGDVDPPTTTYVYDANDNLTKITDPAGNVTEHTYNSRRQVLTTKDPRSLFTVNAYDANGNLLSTKSGGTTASGPFLSETTYTYDPQGNPLSQTTTVGGVAYVTGYVHDTSGRLTRETDALGHVTDYTYDVNGNRLTATTTRRPLQCVGASCSFGSPETLLTRYEYDKNGRVTKRTDPDGSFTRSVYDALGRETESFDKLARRTTHEYDEAGRLFRTTYPDSTFEEAAYDNEGRRLTTRDRGGRTTRYEYDDLGRLVKTTFPDGAFTLNSYDAHGRLVGITDARGKTTAFEYDAAGRRTKSRDPLGNEVLFSHDGNGNLRTLRDARANATTYEYDGLNRRTQTTFPDGTFTLTTYDELGRRTSETDQAGRLTRFEYDKLGRLTKVIDALDQETTFGYDEIGSRVSQTDANGRTTYFLHDKLGREIGRVLPDGAAESKTYDAAGRLLTRTDFMGRNTSYDYDDADRLTARRYPNATENVQFTYTPTGRRLTASDGRGTTTYGYDLRDRLTSLLQPGVGSLSYGYDGNGNRLTLEATIGGQTHAIGYSYDDASRLDIVRDPLNRTYDHGYDANGNRTSLQYPNATVTAYAYDTLNRLTNLMTSGPFGTVQSYAFTLGPAGNRTRIDEADGSIREYAYDALYRLTQDKVTAPGGVLLYQKDFVYDAVGNRLSQTTIGSGSPGTATGPGTVNSSYDTRDRLLTENSRSLTYDSNGNLTAKVGDATYAWDHENRLVRITTSAAVVVHAYDADGNRVRTEVTPSTGPPVVTNFLVDPSGVLSHVVAETDAANALTALYVRGDDLLGVMRPSGPGAWSSRFYAADGIGSVRRLTDESGNVTDTYTTTAFGELIAHTGGDSQPYLFAGEPYDANSGFQFHRARWMDPQSGRFLGLDRHPGTPWDPVTLHRYLYAGDEPVDRTDPSGLFFSIGSFASFSATLTTIAAIALPRLQSIIWWVNINFFRFQRAIEYVQVGLTALEFTGFVAERLEVMARNLAASDAAYPPGPFPRGIQVGRTAGQNLADNFPRIDDFDFGSGSAISIKSTVAIENENTLLGNIRGWAADLDGIDRDLRGRDVNGNPVTVRVADIRSRGLLVAIPDEPIRWNPAAFSARVAEIARVYRTSIKIIPVRGLRGR
jgi:RHS repeat-associated protein